MLEVIRPFLIAFIIGFFIGIERERSHPAGIQAIGMRTFVLYALIGTLAAEINVLGLTITISAFVFGSILLSYFHTAKQKKDFPDVGITTEIAAAVVFALGYLAHYKALLSCILGGVVLLILIGREHLHTFARRQIKSNEMRAAITIFVITIGIVSFLPNHTVDPWGLINPQRLGILILLLSVIQFGGYIALRVFGDRFGIVIMGLFGGLVSSTAVFATLPKLSRRHPANTLSLVAAAVFSVIGMLIELTVILTTLAPKLIVHLIPSIIAMIAVGALSGLLITNGRIGNNMLSESQSPLDLFSVLKLTLFIGGMIFIVALARQYLGLQSMQYIAFIGGLFEIHSISIANATLYISNKITIQQASFVILLAILASYVSKFFLLWTLARNRFALLTSVFLAAMIAGGGATYWFLLHK